MARHLRSPGLLTASISLAMAITFVAVAAAPSSPALAATPSAAPTHTTVHVKVGSSDRTYTLYTPSSLLGSGHAPAPLVIALTAFTQTSAELESESSLDGLADSYGAYLVYPTAANRRWIAGACCGSAPKTVDDVGFLDAVISSMKADYSIDPGRIALVGKSNGAMMAEYYACQRADVVAAIVSVAGTLEAGCSPSRPVSVMQISAGKDSTVPFLGTSWSQVVSAPLVPIPTSVGFWEGTDQCAGLPTTTTTAYSSTRLFAHCSSKTAVQLAYLPNSGHDWPTLAVDKYYATGAIYNFLKAHPQHPVEAWSGTPALKISASTYLQSGQIHLHGSLVGRYDLVGTTDISLRGLRNGTWTDLPSALTDITGAFDVVIPRGFSQVQLESTTHEVTTAASVSL